METVLDDEDSKELAIECDHEGCRILRIRMMEVMEAMKECRYAVKEHMKGL